MNISFFENHTIYEIMWENMIEWGRPQMTIWRMRIACWINKTTDMCNTYCFSTATIVARTRLNITSYVYSCLANLGIAKFGTPICDTNVEFVYSSNTTIFIGRI